MVRLAFFVAIASAWTAALVVVGAYAGWTFVAVKVAGVANVSDPAFAGVDPALLSRFVGGQITRMPFDVINWASILLPAILSSFVGGFPAKLGAGTIRWWHRGALVALAAALLCAIVSVQTGFQLRGASAEYWAAVTGHNAAAAAIAKEALNAVHGRAQSIYFSLTGLAALSTLCGGAFLARRSAIISRP